MGYTATARQALLAAFDEEQRSAGWSATYVYLVTRALLGVPLGTSIDVDEDVAELVGVDDGDGIGRVIDADHDAALDVARVAVQADYFGIDPHA